MRTMGGPDYVYKPRTQAQREAQRARSMERLGVPPGHRLLFGMVVTDAEYGVLEKPLKRARQFGVFTGDLQKVIEAYRTMRKEP
jgi:hypothetical protein